MAAFSVKQFRVSPTLSFALAAAGGVIGCLSVEIAGPSGAPSGAPDPTLLPMAAQQAPNVLAYTALRVATQPAGFSYADPVSRVKIWKATSATTPARNGGAGHDYSDGANQVSRGWGPKGNTHTILIRGDGMAYHLWTSRAGWASAITASCRWPPNRRWTCVFLSPRCRDRNGSRMSSAAANRSAATPPRCRSRTRRISRSSPRSRDGSNRTGTTSGS